MIPTRKPHNMLRLVIKQHLTAYTVERVDVSPDSMGGVSETSTTHTARLWVYSPDEFQLNIDIGERFDGDIQALTLPSEDIQENDRIQYGTDSYEVQGILNRPTEENKQITVLDLSRRTND